MDRTEEFRKLSNAFPSSVHKGEEEDSMGRVLVSAKKIKKALHEYFCSVDRATSSEYMDIEQSLHGILPQAQKVVSLLKEVATEKNFLFAEGVVGALKLAVQRIEHKVEDKRYKRRKSTLNIALEPEFAPPSISIKKSPGMLQLLHEENERILEKVQYTEKEVFHVRRKISEIDTLQKLISQEIFSQDERIDIILSKTTAASIDVKISRTYIKNAGEKRRVARQFLSMLILIFSFMILLLHFSR
ncbi:hypothetical protein NECID01_0925 [Nematocida sp. AWRm77]|nr:hypothetical protein NECID01_0925 [Nematocida sp. AWRm77]